MSWASALKEFATTSGKFVLPKKDSPEYTAVKAIQERMKKETDAPASVAKPKPIKKAKVENVVVPVAEEIPVVAKKAPKVKAAKAAKAPNVEAEPEPEPESETPVVKPKVKAVKAAKAPNVEISIDETVDAPVKVVKQRKTLPKTQKTPNVVAPTVQSHKGVQLVDRAVMMSFD